MTKAKKSTDELSQVSVPTKKIALTITEGEKVEVILRPFKQRHFATAIELIHKYFDSYNSVRIKYNEQRKQILDQYPEEKDESIRQQALEDFDNSFIEGMEIAKAILQDANGEIGEDIKTLIEISIYKVTQIIQIDDATERSPIDLDLDELTWGECLILFGSTIGLNMDFFAQNTEAMNLEAITNPEEVNPKPKGKAGEKLSAA